MHRLDLGFLVLLVVMTSSAAAAAAADGIYTNRGKSLSILDLVLFIFSKQDFPSVTSDNNRMSIKNRDWQEIS